MILYKRKKKTLIHSPDGDTDFFNIVVGVFQGYTLALCKFIIDLDVLLQTSINLIKENVFIRKREKSILYSAEL